MSLDINHHTILDVNAAFEEEETVALCSVADSDQCILEGGYSVTNGDLSENPEKLTDHFDSSIDVDYVNLISGTLQTKISEL